VKRTAEECSHRVRTGPDDIDIPLRDYSGLTTDRADAYGNARRARIFEIRRQLSKLGKPTDRSEWGSLPQILDGFSTRALNQIAFTAGILQRPFFDRPPMTLYISGRWAGSPDPSSFTSSTTRG
jgi:hypothetical protein